MFPVAGPVLVRPDQSAGAHLPMLFYACEVRTYSKVILKVPLMQPAVHAAAPLGKHAPYPEIRGHARMDQVEYTAPTRFRF